MAIVISGVNNNDKITAADGTIDLLSGVSYASTITAPAFTTPGNLTAGHLNVGNNIQLGNAGVATATTFVGNLNGNVNGSAGTLLLQTSGSERIRIGAQGQIGIAGANYGTSGQALVSQGSGSSVAWQTITGTTINNNATTKFITGTNNPNELDCEANLSYNNSLVTFSSSSLMVDKSANATISVKETAGNKEVQYRANTDGGLIRTLGNYPLIFGTNQTERAQIKSDGKVNITPGGPLSGSHPPGDLNIVGTNFITMTPNDNANASDDEILGVVAFLPYAAGSISAASAKIVAVAESGQSGSSNATSMRFYTKPSTAGPGNAGNERLIIKSDGDVQVKTGNLIMSSGKGIDFSADGSGTLKTLPNSFNAELLHDYENGTFTPNIQYDTGTNRYAGSNVSSAVGEYIRIGDLVNFGMKITLTSNQNHSENTHIYIGGLPYNGMHSSQQSSMQNGWGGWACPTNDNNFSYDVRYCFHGYTTVNLGFTQSSGNGGISGFYVWGFYRTAP